MNPVLQEILRSGLARSDTGELIKVHSAVAFEEGKFLQQIIADRKPVLSLEVGLAFGISALFICEALSGTPNVRHIICDPYQFNGSWRGSGLRNLKNAGYGELIEFHNQFSHLALPELESRGIKLDFAFVDGSHTFDYVLLDFFYIDRMLRPGGIIAFDDVGWPGVRKVCRFIVTNRIYSVFRCFPEMHNQALRCRKSRILRSLAENSGRLRRLLSPEFLQTDAELGINPSARCIAFRKDGEDSRDSGFHLAF